MRRAALALAATLAVAAAACDRSESFVGPASGMVIPSDPATHARVEADRLMGRVHVPSSATPTDHSPASALDQPWQTTDTDDIVDEHRWWTLTWDADKALDWLTTHGVERLKSSGTGTSGGPEGVTLYSLDFTGKPPAGIDSEQILMSVAPKDDGTSALRVDAQVVWLPNRPPNETIPHHIDRIEVSAFMMKEQIGHRVLTGAAARRLAKVINGLPTAARAVHGCGVDQGYRLHVVAGSLVFDDDVACFEVAVTDGGKRLPNLAGSGSFVHAVASSMGLPDHPSR